MALQAEPCRITHFSDPDNPVLSTCIVKSLLDTAMQGRIKSQQYEVTLFKDQTLSRGDKVEVLDRTSGDVLETIEISAPIGKMTTLNKYTGTEITS